MPTGLWMSPQGWRWKQKPSDGYEIVDCFCSLQCPSERLRIQKIGTNLAHHSRVTVYVTQIRPRQTGCVILDCQRSA